MKKLLLSAAALLLFATATAQQQPETPWKFSIMAWNATDGNYRFSIIEPKSLFAGMKEAGLTNPGFVSVNQLDAVWAAGMRAYVIDKRCAWFKWEDFDVESVRQGFKELAEATRNHPAVIGYYICDEPLPKHFPGLAQMIELVNEYAPGKIPYINLNPNYAPESALGCTYREYVEQFIEICKPKFISYDFYGIYKPGVNLDPSYVRPGMWANLSLFRELGQKYKLPFQVINLATAHYDFRVPTEADFAFQSYTALAYGASGITYFTYLVPGDWDDKLGPVDAKGNKNPSWYDLAKANKLLLNWGPLLEQLRSTAAYHFPADLPEKQPVPANSLIAAANGGKFLVGDFVKPDDGSRYVMIVNCNLVEAATPAITFRTTQKNVQMVSAGQPGTILPYEPGAALGPGKAMLLKFNTK